MAGLGRPGCTRAAKDPGREGGAPGVIARPSSVAGQGMGLTTAPIMARADR